MATSAVERLHPALIHHLIGTLGWRELRELQELAIEPVLGGKHALLGAPTAAGKTEAAMLPLLSRMASERWSGLSLLYVCPLRALLNNIAPRLELLCELLGRRAAVWHGDVGDSKRRQILADPPDVLLTTPESLEAMFLSRRVDHERLLPAVHAVVVDEIHAFAADDRGWHLLALLCRIDALARTDCVHGPPSGAGAQRVGLSATVGNPPELLEWLCTGAVGPRRVVIAGDAPAEAELEIDYVGSIENAAEVIARLHRGEKRLAFADSRARVEELGAALRARGVSTFISHSSLSADERRQAERAFVQARDCVIVATSTLELGIDIGDLDRVIQLGAPRTVASVQQRLGRTGRRAGTTRNCLFLATSSMELLTALALVRLLRDGWVEPLRAPALPVALAAQQLLARVLAEGRVGSSDWPGAFAPVAATAGLDGALLSAVLAHMLDHGILLEEAGGLQIGVDGERLFGRRHFIELTSMFLSEPLLQARWGQRLLGQLDPSALLSREDERLVVLLGGSSWAVRDVDWERRMVWVEPSDESGRSRWIGPGGALSLEVCQAIRSTLSDAAVPGQATRRAVARLSELRDEHWFAREGATTLLRNSGSQRTRWYTWAGGRANAELAGRLASAGVRPLSSDDCSLTLAGLHGSELVDAAPAAGARADDPVKVNPRRIASIKFHEAIPEAALGRMCLTRDGDPDAVAVALSEKVDVADTAEHA